MMEIKHISESLLNLEIENQGKSFVIRTGRYRMWDQPQQEGKENNEHTHKKTPICAPSSTHMLTHYINSHT